jgi:hypothetical protein
MGARCWYGQDFDVWGACWVLAMWCLLVISRILPNSLYLLMWARNMENTLCHLPGFQYVHKGPFRHISRSDTLWLTPFIITKSGYVLSCCTGVHNSCDYTAHPVAHHNCHNCHGTACPVTPVHTKTVTVELFFLSLHDTNLSFSRNYFERS